MKVCKDQMRSQRSKALIRGMVGGFAAPLMIFPVITKGPVEQGSRSNVEESFRQVGSVLRQAMKKHRSHEPA